jgi:hypothetical protein
LCNCVEKSIEDKITNVTPNSERAKHIIADSKEENYNLKCLNQRLKICMGRYYNNDYNL